MYRELLLGCGYRRHRIIDPLHFKNRQSPGPLPAEEEEERWKNVTTVDLNPACGPDYVMNIDRGIAMPQTDLCDMKLFEPHDFYPELLQFKTNLFDEVHAYEVLEHLGQQGDALSFFQDFDEIWRVLKPDGFLCATVPSRFSTWLWGDPGHRRTIQPATLMFLHLSLIHI